MMKYDDFLVRGKSILSDNNGGVALVLVVWVVVVLIAIVGEFSYSMRTEVNITRNFKEEEEAYQLALAGIEMAKHELLSMKEHEVVYMRDDDTLLFGEGDEEEEEAGRNGELGRGKYSYIITDEDGKIDINREPADKLKYILLETGIDSTDAPTIADSIVDWADTDGLHHLNGAEEDYYQSLEKPYSCKDGPFESIDELLLVKGMKGEYLYGSKPEDEEVEDDEEEKDYEGLLKYFTVYDYGKVNINTASNMVLEALFGLEVASDIINRRSAGPILTPMAEGKVTSEFFSIISTGTNSDGTIKRSVKAVVHKKDKKVETVYWNDNFIG